MVEANVTYINFIYCELEGKWARLRGEVNSDEEIFESLENNAHINVRTFSEEKTQYFFKKDARVIIKGSILKFNKADFA